MEREDKNKILQSQGIKFVRAEPDMRPTSRLVDPLSASKASRPLKTDVTVTRDVSNSEKLNVDKLEIPQAVVIEKKKVSKKNRGKFVRVSSILVIVLCLGYGVYFAWNKFEIPNYLNFRSSSSEKLVKDVGKLVNLPQDESPSIMTVTNLESLSGQVFFREAEVGDKVLVYSKARKAILYRPSSKKVILSASLTD
jgi:hypothetical protein